MFKQTTFVAMAITLGLAGCASPAPDVMILQLATTEVLGLASTDDVTLSHMAEGSPDALGTRVVSYTATTEKGPRFACSALMTPDPVVRKSQYSHVKCKPA
ncbi:hypothetical protein G3N95_05190 [Paraburkholderia sp. Tr-20389]|uniref:hypothetical protein n=1 Tax=Paraburkholderia sp. Tr-20389 TaxID=2703903 RepID=UPI00197D78CF|nr:hypothetical protein [Paraburkholderia sp. Tr-20389]MBN3752322.1 hypothetical protein [Paraburkholderia sp. Tr-20389]